MAEQLQMELGVDTMPRRLAYAIAATKGYCAYCGVDLVQEWSPAYAVDHILPKATYSEHEHTKENWALSCASCNDYKGTYDPLREDECANHMLENCQRQFVLIRRSADHVRSKRAESEQGWRRHTRHVVRRHEID